MPRVVYLDDLVARVRGAADMIGSDFRDDAYIEQLTQDFATELYDLVCGSNGREHYATYSTFNTVPAQDRYPFAQVFIDPMTGRPRTDLYEWLGLELQLDPPRTVTLHRIPLAHRNRYKAGQVSYMGYPEAYCLMGGELWLFPTPQAVHTLRVDYIPITPVVDNVGTFDAFNGWEKFIIASAAAQLLAEEQSDPSFFLAQRTELRTRIESQARLRDAGEPSQVVDVRGPRWWRGRRGGGWWF